MNSTARHILIAALVGAAVFVIYEIYRAYQAGVTAISDLISFPFASLKSIVSGAGQLAAAGYQAGVTVASDAGVAASIPGLIAQSQSLDASISSEATNDYAPGGMTYNKILAASGQAAADNAWAVVQQHLNSENAADSTWNQLTTW